MITTSIMQIIQERRTIRQFSNQLVEIDTIRDIIDVARWAPHHAKTEPWRLILFHGEQRQQVIHMAKKAYTHLSETALSAFLSYLQTVPAFLIVVMDQKENRKQWEDDLCATSAFIQNIQLVAWEKQVGVVWRTFGEQITSRMKEHIGVHGDEKIVGFLQMGYFVDIPEVTQRKSVDELLTIM
ncbi:Nitroreductase [Thermoactinomyces sp. DSM 45891]|uniref:nitroreductase family protein n=1 Tax=Thermoactinomyces sp. DSM 45891 TaxID=1761907 RepID=UPI000912E9E2|nr:nitroreductase [Thermoactinomyces sp. DSM 45891]SFX07582.1 Nitroreductase [Thermoactinomyces sp. DSM 45891]